VVGVHGRTRVYKVSTVAIVTVLQVVRDMPNVDFLLFMSENIILMVARNYWYLQLLLRIALILTIKTIVTVDSGENALPYIAISDDVLFYISLKSKTN